MSIFAPTFDANPYSRAGESLREITFPIGGIGTGSISLNGRGLLQDWEIFGRPDKGLIPEYTFPALWIQEEGQQPRAIRVCGPRQSGFVGRGGHFWDYGHGRFFESMDGLPCFDETIFTGCYPVAHVRFEKQNFPVSVQLAAWNPFVPHDLPSSSFPAVILEYRITNDSMKPVQAVLAWTVQNPVGLGAGSPEKDLAKNQPFQSGDVLGVTFTNDRFGSSELRAGEFVLATDHPDASVLASWSEEGWWDSVRRFWNAFRTDGTFPSQGQSGTHRMPSSLGCRVHLQPGESAVVSFVMAWRFPNNQKVWDTQDPVWCQYYATEWVNAAAVAGELFARREELSRKTSAFVDALYGGSLGAQVQESVGAPLSTLRSPTVLRLEDGTFWAWEGCSAQSGCCEGTCTHVWNYTFSHALLFPEIQASFLDGSLKYGFDCGPAGEEGAMRFRLPIPLQQSTDLWHAASDGQLGQIVQAYRDWRLTGDEDALRKRWPALKKAMSYSWVQWDRDRDGLVDGDMHNTYDINFQGPNPLTQFFYLAALRAMERIALHLGESDVEKEMKRLADAGSRLAVEKLFNGEYFEQVGDFTSPEAHRYQHGSGCLSDQLLGQLCATVAGLGELVEPQAISCALAAIHRHNFRAKLGDHENLQRVYSFPDEQGLLLCSWPRGRQPFYPFPYSDEVWSGFNYQVAAHLAFVGLVDESNEIVDAIRKCYDGRRRSPWNEFECGSHYARALSSYALLLAHTGMRYDAVERTLCFRNEPFRALFSVPGAWGVAQRHSDGRLEVDLRGGALPEGLRILV